MSDYLTNLIQRNRTEGLTVRPRVSSLFEPVGGATLFPETEQVAEASEIVMPAQTAKVSKLESRVEPLSPVRTTIQSRAEENSSAKFDETPEPAYQSQIKHTSRSEFEELQHSAPKVFQHAPPSTVTAMPTSTGLTVQLEPREIEPPVMNKAFGRQRSTQETEAPQEKTQVIAPVIGHSTVPDKTKDSSPPSESVEPNFARPITQVVVQDGPSPKAGLKTNDTASPPAAAPIVTHVKPERVESEIEHPPSPRRPEPITPLVVVKPAPTVAEPSAQLIPQMPTSAPLAESIRAEPPEPVINVTIGRVEVRVAPGMQATPRAPDSRKRSKLMSLDDYLHQRAQGGRR